MFTGLIEEIGTVEKVEKTPQGATLTINCNKIAKETKIGASVAINGACHTVISYSPNTITVNTSNETLSISNFSNLKIKDKVNLEQAMTLTSRIDGHLVSGHIDGTAEYIEKKLDGFSYKMFFKLPENLIKYVIYKGSITINGISLTIASIENNIISVAIIPHSMQNTNLNELKSGDIVNIETDVLAKYIENFSQVRNNTTKITKSFLEENGFA